MGLSIWRELEKSDYESGLHGSNDCSKWQPDLHPSVAIGELIVNTTKYVHLQESHFLVFVYYVQYIYLCIAEHVYTSMSISVRKWLCVLCVELYEECGSNYSS